MDGDELFSRRVSTAGIRAGLTLVEEDLVHPPLYYFLLKATLPVTGDSAAGIRILSLISGVGSIVVVLLFGMLQPESRLPSLAVAAWLALNKMHIFYSQQARSYALYGLLVCLLLLWACILAEKQEYSRRTAFWVVGTVLMIALVYTHYVGAMFIAAVVAAICIGSVEKRAKLFTAATAAVAALAFVPWLLTEARVFRLKQGLSNNLAWEGLPAGYDLGAIWANFLGVLPLPFRGATLLSLFIGILLVGAGTSVSFKTGRILSRRTVWILLFTSVIPPLLLFATSFKPLQLTVFGARHLLPSMFGWLALASVGIVEVASFVPIPKALSYVAVIALCALQVGAWDGGSRRQPYSVIAADLRKSYGNSKNIYTTWPYGIGAPVNFYLQSERVQSLPSPGDSSVILPHAFVVLYRPGIPGEKHQVDALLNRLPNVRESCRYYSSSVSAAFGTEMCAVNSEPVSKLPLPGF